MTPAICMQCGKPKTTWADACAGCGFEPAPGDLDACVRSAYFSVARFDDAAARRDYEQALPALGARIAGGEDVPLDEADEARLRAFFSEGTGWRTSDSFKMVALVGVWLGTPIALLVIAIWLLYSC